MPPGWCEGAVADEELFPLGEGFVIFGVAALEPGCAAIGFEREDMCRDTVEEPAVVGDDHDAAAEVLQAFFEGTQGGDIEVVCGFVEEEEVAAGGEEFGEVDAIAFTA